MKENRRLRQFGLGSLLIGVALFAVIAGTFSNLVRNFQANSRLAKSAQVIEEYGGWFTDAPVYRELVFRFNKYVEPQTVVFFELESFESEQKSVELFQVISDILNEYELVSKVRIERVDILGTEMEKLRARHPDVNFANGKEGPSSPPSR